MPAMAAAETISSPTALPSEAMKARRAPMPMVLAIAMSTAGPGVKVTSRATPQKTSHCENCIVVRPRYVVVPV